MYNIQLQTQCWQEGTMVISYVPQLDISSCGQTLEEAKKNIQDAVKGFLEVAQEQGTLEQILEEAGFNFDHEWKAPELLASERVTVAI